MYFISMYEFYKISWCTNLFIVSSIFSEIKILRKTTKLSLLNFICFKYLKLLIKLLSYINGYNRMLYVTSEIISE